MTMDSDTRQQMLELVYGLLPEADAEDLRQRIARDPQMAHAYAEAERAAELFAAAARLRLPKIPLRPVAAAGPDPSRVSPPTSGPAKRKTSRSAGQFRARAANWVVGLAAAVLLMTSIGAYLYHRAQLQKLAGAHVRLRVTGPAGLRAGASASYSVATTSITGRPLPTEIKYAVYAPGKDKPKWQNETTDENGQLQIAIAAVDGGPRQMLLKVVARGDDPGTSEQIEAHLAVEPPGYVGHLTLDKPLYRPGEIAYYRCVTLSRFGLAADRQIPVEFEILGPSGGAVPGSQLQGVTHRGVGNGAFPIPRDLPGGQYALIARSLDDTFPETRHTFFVRRYRLPRLKKQLEFGRDSYAPGDVVTADLQVERAEGGPAAGAQATAIATVDGQTVLQENSARADDAGSLRIEFALPEKIERGAGQLAVVVDDGGNRETIAKTIPINLGKLKVSFYPEGGELVAALENRVYFAARDPLGEPVHIEGMVVNSSGMEVARVVTTHEGMGSFHFRPRANERYRLKISSPGDVDSEPELPEASAQLQVVLNTGTGVFAAGEPLEFNIRATKPGLPLVVSAWCRGAMVGQRALVTAVSQGRDDGANPVAIPLADDIGGVIRLTVHDYSVSPPKPVAERLVYRRMARKLQVHMQGQADRYLPGDTVDILLQITDETGKPVPAVLGVSVVDDALLDLADDQTPKMTTCFLLSSEIEDPEDLEHADFYLSGDPQAAVALDLLLGTQGWRRFVERTLRELQHQDREDEPLQRLVALDGVGGPPVVFDNLAEIRTRYDKHLAAYQQTRTRLLNTLTTVSFVGGLGLLLLVAMLGLLKLVSGVHLWVPAVGVTACCVIIGVILTGPGGNGSDMTAAVAFQGFAPSPPEVAAVTKPKNKQALLERYRQEQRSREEERADLYARGDEFELALEEASKETPPGGDYAQLLALMPEMHYAYRGTAEYRDRARYLAGGLKELDPVLLRKLDAEAFELADLKQLAELDRLPLDEAGRLSDKWQRGELAEWLKQYRFVVRQYAHKLRRSDAKPDQRCDFAETLFWHPLLIADKEGRAHVRFDLSDSITTFHVRVDGHGAGRIGSGGGELLSRIPFNLEPKLPLEVSAGDRIDLPLAVVNDTSDRLPVELSLDCGHLVKLDGPSSRKVEPAGEQRIREYFRLDVTGEKGECELTFRGAARGSTGGLEDAVTRPLSIVPPGFPHKVSHSGRIDGQEQVVVDLPESWIPGSLEVTLTAFPSMLAELQQGMDDMLREPCGCFEQASSSNYPNVLSLQYMQQNNLANPAVTRRARELLKAGYEKLVGYECSSKGYEWFGGDPGHEALTAYGLMQFRDMAEVYNVDREMVSRTTRWLMDRRDGRGGFMRNAKALDSFGQAPNGITNAYITWALSEAAEPEIETEVKRLAQSAEASDDPYLIALAAASLINTKDQNAGEKLLGKLAEMQAEDGHLQGTQGSITRSGGQSLKIETTALAALAWLKTAAFAQQANRAVQWIIENRQGSGGFGTTQATILALKALIEHAKANRRTLTAGKLIVKRDDMQIGEHAFEAGRQETIVLDGLEAHLQPGRNKVTASLTGDNKMPYALDVSFRSRKPADDENCPLRLSTKLSRGQAAAGETVGLTAELVNVTDQGQPMTVAILGLPAGSEPRADQLEELREAGTIDYYETRARQVICYWRSLAPKQTVTVKLDLVAAVPGLYTGPASRAYLYYTSEQKRWSDPLKVEITRQ